MSTFSGIPTGTFADRLREAIGGESTHAFGKRAGINDTSMRQYLAGGTPGIDKAVLIADAAGVSVEWLITGKGSKTGETEKPIIHKDLNQITPEIVQKAVSALKRHIDDQKADMDPDSLGEAAAILCEMAAAAGGFSKGMIERILRIHSGT